MKHLFSSYRIKNCELKNRIRIVITIGNRPDNRLFDQIKPLGYEIHQIGDCLEPRSARAAIYEGAVLGRAI